MVLNHFLHAHLVMRQMQNEETREITRDSECMRKGKKSGNRVDVCWMLTPVCAQAFPFFMQLIQSVLPFAVTAAKSTIMLLSAVADLAIV